MELLTSFLENSQFPLLSAFILGLMTAISPCPLATNITAIGYISKDIENRKVVFYNGLIYTFGRMIAYTLLAVILYFGANQVNVSSFFQLYGEKFIGPLMIIIGLVMLGILNLKFPGFSNISEKISSNLGKSRLSTFLLGVVFALAFCPYSGVLYFGILIPLTVSSASGLLLPPVFAIGTGIPVLIFAWLIAFAISGLGNWYDRMKNFEKWFRRIVGILFIASGIYLVAILFL